MCIVWILQATHGILEKRWFTFALTLVQQLTEHVWQKLDGGVGKRMSVSMRWEIFQWL